MRESRFETPSMRDKMRSSSSKHELASVRAKVKDSSISDVSSDGVTAVRVVSQFPR